MTSRASTHYQGFERTRCVRRGTEGTVWFVRAACAECGVEIERTTAAVAAAIKGARGLFCDLHGHRRSAAARWKAKP